MDRVVVANTFNAHRLLQAYFTEGANVDDSSTLRTLATEVGLDATQASALLAGDAFADEVRRDMTEARQNRISGVPFFVFDQKYAISGAQLPELFDQALARAHAEWRDQDLEPVTA